MCSSPSCWAQHSEVGESSALSSARGRQEIRDEQELFLLHWDMEDMGTDCRELPRLWGGSEQPLGPVHLVCLVCPQVMRRHCPDPGALGLGT